MSVGRSSIALTFIATVSLLFVAAAPLRAQNYSLKSSIAIPGEGGWDYAAADAAGRRLYVSHGTEVVVLDLDSRAIVGKIPNTNGVHGIAIAANLGKGYVSAGRDNVAVVFDLKTLKTLATVKTGQNPDGILYEASTKRVFTFNGRGSDATVIDATSDTAIATLPMGGKPEFPATDNQGNVWVNIETKGEILHFKADNPANPDHWSIKPCDEPSGLAFDAAGRRLFSVCDKVMAVTDADKGTVVATLKIGDGPDAAAWDPEMKLAFSSNGQDGTLTVIKQDTPDTYRVVQTVKTARGARTMALDTKTHTIYLPAAEFGPAPAPTADQPRPRPKIVPGTFKLLVVSE